MAAPARKRIVPSVPGHGFGNQYCFGEDGVYSFERCCGLESAACFDGSPYSFEACCQTTPAVWIVRGAETVGLMNLIIGCWWIKLAKQMWRGFGSPPCAAGGAVPREQLERIQDLSGRWDEELCRRSDGRAYGVVVYWADNMPHETGFSFCAPKACASEEVTVRLLPSLFYEHTLGKTVGLAVVQKVVTTELGDGVSPRRFATGGMGPGTPPIEVPALEEYIRTYQVCGRCPLRRYGDSNDGGYLMCDLGGASAGYLGAYSYGIAASDGWGFAVAQATGAILHQYDCTLDELPLPCSPNCTSRFHPECLSWERSNTTDRGVGKREGRRRLRYETLDSHLQANGHAEAPDGSLLLKMDIEGSEWASLWQADVAVLRKFRQLVVEFHIPLLSLMDVDSWEPRMGMMRNLLPVFAVVHVHVNNGCQGAHCLEVTFAHRGFIQEGPCEWPRRHPLDEPNAPGRPDIDVRTFFPPS